MSSNVQRRTENLAFCFGELLTVGERLRSSRQAVQDAETFRMQLRESLKGAENEARRRGYNGEDTQLATFATVAFLDESILNLQNPIFADWPRRPLSNELFGHQVAGEIFFRNLHNLLKRDESQETADLLEVYQICMLLGFAGRYGIGNRGELKSIMDVTGEKIRRIRQIGPDLSPLWALPSESAPVAQSDPWVKRLMFAAAGFLLVALVLFGFYKMSLGSAVGNAERIASEARS